ncbi:hypothetical protein ABEG18_03200 [Alsobacter sp. KACC 23698]|uniref:Lectin-like protein BA14k n=1 Tax=Alsobacter sp. KACC 23698 TaxID=3149229 RepID=A0AAU7JII8_9HYPH
MLRIIALLSTAAAIIVAAFIGLVLYYPAQVGSAGQQAKIGPQYNPGQPIAVKSVRAGFVGKAAASPAQPVRAAAEAPVRAEDKAAAEIETGSISPPAMAQQTAAAPEKASARREVPKPASATTRTAQRFAPGAAGCTGFSTYDARTQTYRGFDGRTHECRPGATRSAALRRSIQHEAPRREALRRDGVFRIDSVAASSQPSDGIPLAYTFQD